MSDEYKDAYHNLCYKYSRLEVTNSDLKKELNVSNNKLDTAEYKIRNELEPRIKQEHRSYDSYVTSGGSNECFRNGDSGKCGEECSVFASKPECTQDIEDKELLTMYEDGYLEIGDELSYRGYDLETSKIDLTVLKEKIAGLLTQKRLLIKDIWKYRWERLFRRNK